MNIKCLIKVGNSTGGSFKYEIIIFPRYIFINSLVKIRHYYPNYNNYQQIAVISKTLCILILMQQHTNCNKL